MRYLTKTILLLIVLSHAHFLTGQTNQQKPMELWYNQPAPQTSFFPYGNGINLYKFVGGVNGWREALPIGNGRMGAMIFGDVFHERIQLNEESLWDGYKRNSINPESAESLPVIRKLLFENKAEEASALAEKTMLGIPTAIKSYQSLADLYIDMPVQSQNFSEYKRGLNIDSALATVQYRYEIGRASCRERV